jgi:hypothetical protein
VHQSFEEFGLWFVVISHGRNHIRNIEYKYKWVDGNCQDTGWEGWGQSFRLKPC